MKKLITKYGVAILRDAITKQNAKVRAAGAEIGEAAGPNCDWHDNFAYEDALRRHEMESGRLSQFSSDLSDSQVVEIIEQDLQVAIGTTVTLLVGEEERTLTIGGTREDIPNEKLISADSPIAKAVFGLRRDEAAEARIGARTVTIEVIDIRPPSYRYTPLIEKHLASLGINFG